MACCQRGIGMDYGGASAVEKVLDLHDIRAIVALSAGECGPRITIDEPTNTATATARTVAATSASNPRRRGRRQASALTDPVESARDFKDLFDTAARVQQMSKIQARTDVARVVN